MPTWISTAAISSPSVTISVATMPVRTVGTWDALVSDDNFQPDFGGTGNGDWVSETELPTDGDASAGHSDQDADDIGADSVPDGGSDSGTDDSHHGNDVG